MTTLFVWPDLALGATRSRQDLTQTEILEADYLTWLAQQHHHDSNPQQAYVVLLTSELFQRVRSHAVSSQSVSVPYLELGISLQAQPWLKPATEAAIASLSAELDAIASGFTGSEKTWIENWNGQFYLGLQLPWQ